ncbi:hypothetical protein PVAND_015656 [Polypedilum vanderplanki]|uniref:Peregrin-like protein n=1 Tax=Polypedilum vanderplanki TaxID=319348 RepID=A0A9J6BCW8_POLVA|nr:hypothetical protein PVAND_015656 [Polypedilum vanderplanki]
MIDFDIPEYIKSIKGQSAPFKCPACEKSYKSVIGLQYHLKNHDRDPSQPTTPVTPTPKKRKKGKNTPKIKSEKNKTPQTPVDDHQIILDDFNNLIFKVNGKTIPFPVEEELPLIDMKLYEKMTSHSNYEIEDISPPIEPHIQLPQAVFRVIDDYQIADAPPKPTGYIRFIEKTPEELDGEVEYDVDEEDTTWLEVINEKRRETNLSAVSVETLELLIDRLEKESYFQAASNGQAVSIIDEDAICCICMDGECQNTNVILFCDMCNLAVHQDCYGVPYIPENQWLCRQCLQSPSRPVECKLCPNSGGAFKQTDTNEWAHVVCALWIPEVRFANTVFLEPIDSIDCIPPARWRLVCYICKQKTGACIQCNKNYCYSAFHVTCAQYAGLCMRMETVKSADGQMMVQKSAFCDQHTPIDMSPAENEKAREECRNKMKQARKMLAKKRSSAPIILIPTIPPDRVQEITNLVNFKKKDQFMQRLIAYWTLKRQFRNGVPLLRRLQTSQASNHSRSGLEGSPDAKELYKQLKYWQHLRQDLERARLLCELVRKREKLKLLLIKATEECVLTELNPLGTAMNKIIDQLVAKDTLEIFLEPVDVNEVPDYATVIKNPIDLGTMREKLKSGAYNNLDDLEVDFNLMIKNCLLYNNKDTIFYKMGLKMKEQGATIFRHARRELEKSGMIEAPMADAEIIKIIDSEMKEILSKSKPSVEAVKKLESLQTKASTIKHHLAKAKKTKVIKMEIIKMKKLMNRGKKVDSDSEDDDDDSSSSSSSEDDEEEDKSKTDLKTPTSSPLKSSSLGLSSPSNSGVNRRNAVLFTRKQQILKKPELSDLSSLMKGESLLGSLSTGLDEIKKPDDKRRGRGRRPGWRKHGNTSITSVENTPSTSSATLEQSLSNKKPMLLTPSIKPNTNITLETPKFDTRIPESFRVYRGQGSNSEKSDASDFSDSCTSCEFSESYTNSEYGSSGDEEASDSDAGSNNSDSNSFNNNDEDSQASATTTTRTKDEDDHSEEEAKNSAPLTGDRKLKALQLVWAKSRGYPWYPALIIDPNIPKGFVHNSVPLPCPPDNVLTLRKPAVNEDQYLVLFFDTKRTWQWLTSKNLEQLGVNKAIDESKLNESKKPALRKAVKKAYEEALHYQSQVTKKKPEGKL